jgi:hypothetical protein
VGDRLNPRSAGAGFPPWPFISQLKEGCSQWLSERLEDAVVPEAQLYWVNANRSDGAPVAGLQELVERLAPRLIVALGGNAAQGLDDADLAHVQVHHPQHWKRFHFHHAYVLGKVLRRGLGL